MFQLLMSIWPIALPVLGILILGVGVGGYNERRHLRDLAAREQAVRHIRVNNLRHVTDADAVAAAGLVMGNVVIATDYFKSFATALRGLVGGEMRAAQMLMTRARREALLRLLEQAHAGGATEVWNVRFGFSNISQMRGKRGAMQVEVIAWATAVRRG
jgi:uncharacterized protein YbjQ (UPF0145 family)